MSGLRDLFKEDKLDGIDLSYMSVCGLDLSYIEGFGTGAVILARKLERPVNDALLFPACFLFRHYVELELKWIVATINAANGSTPTTPLLTHKLRLLWDSARPMLVASLPDVTTEAFDSIQELIYAFSDIDPKGEDFRYWADTKGDSTLTGVPKQIERASLVDSMERVMSFLKHWAFQL